MTMTPGEVIRRTLGLLARRPMTPTEVAIELGRPGAVGEFEVLVKQLAKDGHLARIDRGLGDEYVAASELASWQATRDPEPRGLGASAIRVAGGASPSR